jgi:glycosyltransferase involved in cell wall biosynthesis
MAPRMKRTHLTYIIGSLSSGGSERQLIELLRRIDRTRFRVSLALFETSTADRATGLVDELFSLQIPPRSSSKTIIRAAKVAAAMLRLARYLRRTKPNIVHAILPASCILAASAARLARVRVVIAGRRSMSDCYRTDKLLTIADYTATRWCHYAVGNSEAIRHELIETDGLPAERVGVIYNGVDAERFRPGNRELRRQFGWNDENVVFGIVANFISYKRHSDFIRAAALIAKSNPNARFVMAGEDRGILDDLRRQIHESGLEQSFTIIQGMLDPERLYPALDVYICTSQTEGMSNVLLEAGACGVPLIATHVGGNPEIIIDGNNGFLVPPAAPEAIAAKALLLASNPGLRALMGDRARQRAVTQFSMAAMVQAHETLYGSLLAAKKRRSSTVRQLEELTSRDS